MVAPQIAAIHYPRGQDIDLLLDRICDDLTVQGARLGGLLQVIEGKHGGNCATSVKVFDLRTRKSFNIWEDRGACAKGCRLNERILMESSSVVEEAITDRVDLLIINRFGRAESEGRGLLDYFSKAALAGIPVLTAVRAPYDEAWRRYHEGSATELPFDHNAACSWARLAIAACVLVNNGSSTQKHTSTDWL